VTPISRVSLGLCDICFDWGVFSGSSISFAINCLGWGPDYTCDIWSLFFLVLT
jgi:hypothetical protein